MAQSRSELIDIVGRSLVGPRLWNDPRYRKDPMSTYAGNRDLAEEIVTALRPEAKDPKPCGHEDCYDNRCLKRVKEREGCCRRR